MSTALKEGTRLSEQKITNNTQVNHVRYIVKFPPEKEIIIPSIVPEADVKLK